MAQELKQRDIVEGISLMTGVVHELKLQTRLVGARLPGEFRRFRSFPGPNTLLLAKKVLDHLATKADAEIVVVGHSDRFGSAASNGGIAKKRAEATVALLTGDLRFFEAQFEAGDELSVWGATEVDDMLEAIDAASGFGASGSLLRSFKASNGLGTDDALDAATISRVCERYLALLGPRQLDPARFHAVGAGSEQPVLGLAGTKPGTDDVASPDFRDRRRVEVFVFENLILPSIKTFKEGSPQLEPTYKIWCDACEFALTVDAEPLAVRLRDATGQPLPGRSLELLRIDDSGGDTLALVAIATTDDRGVARFPGQLGPFTVRLASTSSADSDETLVTARPDRVNRFFLHTLSPEANG